MKHLILAISIMTLTGCATVQSWIPSFWDDNQSAAIVTIRQITHNIDCEQDQLWQSERLVNSLQWFRLYGESKGTVQRDVLDLVKPMEKTAQDWRDRNQSQAPASVAYCETKKRILRHQADRAAAAVLGRW